MKKLLMTLESSSAGARPFLVGSNIIESVITFFSQAQQLVIITDHHVKKIYGDALREMLLQRGFRVLLLSFSAGEKSKNAKTKEKLELAMLREECGRDTTILALGGGVVGDLAGFVAATYLRGVSYVQLPTTLLAMVDSSIGGKTGINTAYGKNLIGAFWQPKSVIADVHFLKTLSQKQFINGLVEMVKIFLTCDAKRFSFLQQNRDRLLEADISWLQESIAAAAQLKIKIVEADERETGERMILNFGHTIGHAIEFVSRYKIMHGTAVALGILVELKIGELLGLCSREEFEIVHDFFGHLKISTALLATMNPAQILEATRVDKKKRSGVVRYVLLKRIGTVARLEGALAQPVEDAVVMEALRQLVLP